MSSTARLLVIALGEASRAAVEAAVARQFGAVTNIEWLDRAEVRRRPLQTLTRLTSRSFDAAVLVAPDLSQPRLRLTSFLLALPRATARWRIDLRGGRERWSLGEHLARHGPAIVRHAAACLLACTLGVPLLGVIDRAIAARYTRRATSRGPKKVLYMRSQLWLGLEGGGSVAHTAGVIGGLSEAGVEVRAVASDRLAGVDVPTRVVPPEVWFDGWCRELEDLAYNVAFFSAALDVARATRPDAIYQRHAAFNVSGAVLSRLLGIPLVLEFNSSELWKGRYWGGLRLRRAAALVERINLRAADHIVVVSRVLRDDLARIGTEPEKILVNPNGVDPRVFRPDVNGSAIRQKFGIDNAEVVVGFSGTFGLWHGIPTLAAVVPRVLDARPNVRWLLIGDGPLRPLVDAAPGQATARSDDGALAETHSARAPGDEPPVATAFEAQTLATSQATSDEALRDLGRATGVADNAQADSPASRHRTGRVILAGMVPHREMAGYLAACDVLVSPHGRQADGAEFFGSPTKLYEYMAMGRPIVASAIGQIRDVLCDERSALLVPPDDVDALYRAILRLVDDAALRERLGRAAREAAEAQHTWRQNAERVLQCMDGQP